jgi:hypothetical protein
MSRQEILSWNPVDIFCRIISNMSNEKKERFQISTQTLLVLLGVAVLFGQIDVRRAVENLNAIPEIQRKQNEQGERLKEIFEVLKRHKLVEIDEFGKATATASYE